MRKPKRYLFNPGTLSYELEKVPATRRIFRLLGLLALSFIFFAAAMWLMSSVLHIELPKTALLRMNNAAWQSSFDVLDKRMDDCRNSLKDLSERDDEVYRRLFGLGDIPADVRNAGIAGVNRYLEIEADNPKLALQAKKIDRLLKMAVVQSRSFDEVETVAKLAGDIAQAIPSICPLNTAPGNFRYSSSFGYRSDPLTGARGDRHTGIDFACDRGTPVFAPGDGVVSMAQPYYGYGNFLVIDHGFGYQTRYGHLLGSCVSPGDTVRRGDCVAYTGNSGRTTGPHLHYEVLYRGTPVNPLGFFDMEMPSEDYSAFVREPESIKPKGKR